MRTILIIPDTPILIRHKNSGAFLSSGDFGWGYYTLLSLLKSDDTKKGFPMEPKIHLLSYISTKERGLTKSVWYKDTIVQQMKKQK